MAKPEISSVGRESVTGDSVGRDIPVDVISASADTLTGDRYGLLLMAESSSVAREKLTGDRYGLRLMVEVFQGIQRERLTGDGLGQNRLSGGAVVYRESLIQEPPFKFGSTIRESLVSLENEPLTVGRIITSYSQSVMMLRPAMPLPSSVKSFDTVATLREQAVQKAVRPWARSTDFAGSLVMQSTHMRASVRPAQVWSLPNVWSLRQQVVRSRDKVYVPVSEVRIAAERQSVVQGRDFVPGNQVRSPIQAGKLVQQWIASRARIIVIITTEAHVGQHIEQVVQQDTRPAPRSEIDTGGLVQMTVQKHTVVPPGIDDRVGQLVEQVTIPREPSQQIGDVLTYAMRGLAVMQRAVEAQRSITYVHGGVMMAVQHLDTVAPAYALGRHTASQVQQAVIERTTVRHESFRIVGGMRLAFVLGRDVPAPWDVIDPAIGRHAFSLSHLIVQHRETEPPTQIMQSRWVHGIYGQVVVADEFPEPDYPPPVLPETVMIQAAEIVVLPDVDEWAAVSAVQANAVVQSVVVGDAEGWIDATIPQSAVQLAEIVQVVALGDTEFPGSMVSQAHAEVPAIMSHVAHGDQFPDPFLPQSEVETRQVIEFAALGDLELPDPRIPVSDAVVRRVGAITVLGDDDLTGKFQGSEIRIESVVEFLVLRDRSLVGIPLRGGPRPIVTVSMT